jgi:hypothetical protein
VLNLKNKYIFISLFCAISISNSFGAVNDIIPGDYQAPLANSTIMSLNYLTKELNTSSLPNNQYIKQNSYALRYTYGFDIDGKILALGVAIPYSDLKTHGDTLSSLIGEKSTGFNDMIFSSTYWFINDRKNKNFLALTMTYTTPSGKYNESQVLNTGDNKYKTTFNLGYITKISENFLIEISPEIAFYGDNETQNSTTEQKTSYAINSNLRYKPNNKYEIFAGFQENYQSETIKNGIEQNNDCFYQKYSFGGAYYTDKFDQIILRFAKEVNKKYGFETDKEILLRYRWSF